MTSRRALSLLEVVVALAIVALAAAAGARAFGSFVDFGGRSRAEVSSVLRAATVRRTLAAWLAAASLPEGSPGLEGAERARRLLDDDEMQFLTTAATPVGRSEVLVHLFIDRDPATPERGLVAEVRPWRGAGIERVELVPQATSLGIRYHTSLLGESRWVRSWLSTVVLPRAVELRIAAPAADPLPPLLALPLTVTLEGGR